MQVTFLQFRFELSYANFSKLTKTRLVQYNSQVTKCGLAQACHEWLSLLKDDALHPHIEKVKARFHQAAKPFHYAAYLLHPTFRGKDLSADQRESARKWISDRNPQFVPLLVAYDTQSALFPNSFFSERMMKSCPILWWKGALKDPNLSSVSASKFCFD